MALIKCSNCKRDVKRGTATCPHCGAPVQGHASAGFGLPTPLRRRQPEPTRFHPDTAPKRVKPLAPPAAACPRCRGRGKLRDRNLLPWNNMVSFAIVLGVAGLIGSACLEQDGRALLIGGIVSGFLGVALYVAGERCPVCKGTGRHTAGPQPATGHGVTPTSTAEPTYVQVASDREARRILQTPSQRRR